MCVPYVTLNHTHKQKLKIIHTEIHTQDTHTIISQGMTTTEGVTDVSSDCHAPGDCGETREINLKKLG